MLYSITLVRCLRKASPENKGFAITALRELDQVQYLVTMRSFVVVRPKYERLW